MGPLAGVKVIEIGGVGPGPFCGMLLADLGAEVIRIVRVEHVGRPGSLLERGRRSLALDLKAPAGVDIALRLVRDSHVLIEGFRPGVMERLGLGPEVCLEENPGLIYGRVTGWGQEGPLAGSAGHDINYIALSGALYHIGPRGGAPIPPLNLVGDFGGGGMLLTIGILAALWERAGSGEGQVIDAAMVDGSALLMTTWFDRFARGSFTMERGTNILDGNAPQYGVYETADGKFVSIGALEPQFYALLLEHLDLSPDLLGDREDTKAWPDIRDQIAAQLKSKTCAEWQEILENTDACFAPVLSICDALEHNHNKIRKTFIEVDDVYQPAPVPRFSRSSLPIPRRSPDYGIDTNTILYDIGIKYDEIGILRQNGIIG